MQPTSSEKPTELIMWWPHPDSFQDLEVTDNEEGWELSAPDGTELSDWIAYWNQSEEHHKLFEQEFTKVLIDYAEHTLEKHGQTEAIPDEQNHHRSEAEEDSAR